MYVGFMDLENMYDSTMAGEEKLLNEIKCMYVNSLACLKVKGGYRECFMIDSGVRQGCIMSP